MVYRQELIELSGLAVNDAAGRLLGCELVRDLNGRQLIGRIVETEAYGVNDQASHSYRGVTKRNQVMFGAAGRAYVYFTYGMHFCLNIVTGPAGQGEAVLIRALEPLAGIDQMVTRRHNQSKYNLCNGPAKLCQALGIGLSLNGHDLTTSPLRLVMRAPLSNSSVVWTPRIGIRHARDRRWRALDKDSRFLSRPL